MIAGRWAAFSDREKAVVNAILGPVAEAVLEFAALAGKDGMDAEAAKRTADVAEIVIPILAEIRGKEFPPALVLSAMVVAEDCREIIERQEPK